MIKVLNLYAGIGGNRKLWSDVQVTAVEFDEEIAEVYKNFYPDDEVIVEDAHEYLKHNAKNFDFIWASPPCQTHSRLNLSNKNRTYVEYPDMRLYQEIIYLKALLKKPFVVENVKPYYEPLITPSCEIDRHYFWTNLSFYLTPEIKKEHRIEKITNKSIVYGFDLSQFKINALKKRTMLRNMLNPKIGKYFLDIYKSMGGK